MATVKPTDSNKQPTALDLLEDMRWLRNRLGVYGAMVPNVKQRLARIERYLLERTEADEGVIQ